MPLIEAPDVASRSGGLVRKKPNTTFCIHMSAVNDTDMGQAMAILKLPESHSKG